MKKSDWIWMPHPGHFICAERCQFRLNTYVGGHVVSTVGEFRAGGNGKMEELGCNGRLYETMVFPAMPSDEESSCCPWIADVSNQEDCSGYKDSSSAFYGHMAMCDKWSRR